MNAALLEQIKAAGKTAVMLAVCASFPYLAQYRLLLADSAVAWGTQDVSAEACGAFTGEMAVPALSEFGYGYVIVGHLECRSYHGETDAQVAAKALHALEHGITSIVCVGKTPAQRKAGEIEQAADRQLDAVLEVLSAEQLGRAVMAYEPAWTIDTGKTASSEQAQAVYTFPRARVTIRDAGVVQHLTILYGGSAKPDNAGELLTMADIDGGLIGGASPKAKNPLTIGRV